MIFSSRKTVSLSSLLQNIVFIRIIAIYSWYLQTFEKQFVLKTKKNFVFAKSNWWLKKWQWCFYQYNIFPQSFPNEKLADWNVCITWFLINEQARMSKLKICWPLFGISCIGNRIHERQNNFDDNNKAHSFIVRYIFSFAISQHFYV